MLENRPNSDELLEIIQQEEKNSQYGKLKIFFGYAAGVGKTYAMLDAAHVAKNNGIDVIVGYIEPHTRPETMSLLEGLEILAPLKVQYKGITLNEFDLDAAIKRKPDLILVDELAHTNAKTCRHIKRYQDIQELLKAGIDVYTTVNVQHIESLNDIVASITGITVRERIPDHVFDNAHQVELIDIEPEDLVNRLKRGKVYKENQAKRALNNFFNMDNLIALREIALRRTADRVNIISEKAKHLSSKLDYFTSEHILVCLSPSPSNPKAIRTAARMANAFKGAFTALYVETSNYEYMTSENKTRLHDNFKLAEQLGAKVTIAYDDNIAFQIAEFARLSGISKVVLGRSNTKKRFIFPKPTFVDTLTSLAPNLDIYIIPDKKSASYRELSINQRSKESFSLAGTLKTIGIIALSTIIGLLFQHLGFSEANIITIYILGVLLTSLVASNKIYSVSSSILSVLVFNFFFTDPKYSLQAYNPRHIVTFIVMFLSAFITSSLTIRIKEYGKQAAQTAFRTKLLLETNQILQNASDINSIINGTANQLIKLLNKPVIFYQVENNNLTEPMFFCDNTFNQDSSIYMTQAEKTVAEWVFKNNKHAGATTNTLPGARCLYLAVRGNEGVYAVAGIALDDDIIDSFENSMIISILGECAVVLEKELLSEIKKQAEIKAQREQLRANLLRAISHDLRTPLTTISGNAAVLMNSSESLSKEKINILYEDIYDDSMWLINLVENLLSVTRIEDGTINIHMEGELLEEVISEALKHINRKSIEHNIKVSIKDEFIMAKMDSQLIIQVIINIVDNAIKYTPLGSTIEISVRKNGEFVIVDIKDNGNGITDVGKSNIFEMFYTEKNASADSRRGLGLGLSLCKSIINVHGGTISVRDNEPHGSIFSFTLKAEEVNLNE